MTHKERLQKVFDTVVRHLLDQGQPSIDEDGHCAYRGRDGRKCAIGALIADEHYQPCMEGVATDDIIVVEALNQSLGFDVCEIPLGLDVLAALQETHDETEPKDWMDALLLIADEYGLSDKEIAV